MTLLITDGFPRGLGYLEIDHSQAGGPAPIGLPPHFETHTYTCSHCQRVVVMNPKRTRERYKCRGCNHHVCDDCEAERVLHGAPCKTFAQKADEAMERAVRQATPTILP